MRIDGLSYLVLLACALQFAGCDDGGTASPNALSADAESINKDGATPDGTVEVDGMTSPSDLGPDAAVSPADLGPDDPDIGPDDDMGIPTDGGNSPDVGPDAAPVVTTPGLRGRLVWTTGVVGTGVVIGGSKSTSQRMTLQGRTRWLRTEAQR